MTFVRRIAALDTPGLLRLGVLGLALLGIIGTAVELVFLKHWAGTTQRIVWPGMLACVVALGLIVWRPRPATVWTARALAVGVLAIAGLGIWFHVEENLDAGPLDRAYADTWDAMGPIDQLWVATTGQVGPAPTLAPGAMAEISLALLLATVRLPMPARRVAA